MERYDWQRDEFFKSAIKRQMACKRKQIVWIINEPPVVRVVKQLVTSHNVTPSPSDAPK